MGSSILFRYILAFLGLTLIVLIISLGVSLWSVERGFLGYVNDVEALRLEQAQQAIAGEYQRSGGNWNSMRPRRLEQLLFESAPNRAPPGAEQGPRQRPRPGPGMDRPPRGERSFPPTAVYDASGQHIAGARLEGTDNKLNRASIVVNGVVVGELRSGLRHKLSSPQEEAFLKQQIRALWITGIAAMALALALSILLARSMLSPIRRMQKDVSELSSGDYSIRLDSDRADELGDLMRNLDRLAVTLDESRESRQQWFANVSHELRTPVAVLMAELEAMQDGVRPTDGKQLESLKQEVQRLRFLIDDLYELSVSDIGGLRYELSPLSLNESLAAALEEVKSRVDDWEITLSFSGKSLLVNADVRRIDQLWQNLLGNSLAYTDAPGKIVARVYREARSAVVLIEDSPPGVTVEECDRLFEPLYRNEFSRSRRTGGAGLGLAICQKVVEAHGGEIAASPSRLGGLCIRIELPLLESDDE